MRNQEQVYLIRMSIITKISNHVRIIAERIGILLTRILKIRLRSTRKKIRNLRQKSLFRVGLKKNAFTLLPWNNIIYAAVVGILLITTLALSYHHSGNSLTLPDSKFKCNGSYVEMTPSQIVDYQKAVLHFNELPEFEVELHEVQLGENYWSIAWEHGVNIDTVFGFNPYLDDLYAVCKERILIPNKRGVIHIIVQGESLTNIAVLYRTSVDVIIAMNPSLRKTGKKRMHLKEGGLLFIPNAQPCLLTQDMSYRYNLRSMFISPTSGAYTSGYGYRVHPILHTRKFHKGLDIKVHYGQPICTAAGGVVIYAGWGGGYGNYVKVDHGSGWVTGYGHLSRITCRQGQRIRQGQIIGKGGSTGRSTGPHLDFQIYHNGKTVNPAEFIW